MTIMGSQIWEQQESEKSTEYAKFLLFRDMVAQDRSRLGAYKLALEKSGKKREKAGLPRRIPSSWQDCADKWQWEKRADAHDTHLRTEEEAKANRLKQLEEEEEARLLSAGYARKARRIEQLTILFDDLKASYHKPEAEGGEIVYQWLTPDKVREMRGCLDDIARELNERARQIKQEVTNRDEGAAESLFNKLAAFQKKLDERSQS